MRHAFGLYASDFLRVAVPAVVIFGPLAVAETFAEEGLHEYWEHGGGAIRLALLVTGLAATSASLFGQTLFAGVLDNLVGARRYGYEDRSLARLLWALPFRRLIVANVVVTLLVAVGYVLLVVPGLVLLTLLSIVGPLVNIERKSVSEALRHSVRLVRPYFWLAFFAVTVPLVLEHALGDALNETVWERGILAALLANAGLALVVGAGVGLVEVTLAHELIHRDRRTRPA